MLLVSENPRIACSLRTQIGLCCVAALLSMTGDAEQVTHGVCQHISV